MIRGILPALLTPMDDDGVAVNHQTLRRLVDYHIQCGVSGFFVCGGTGEGLLMAPEERQAVLETVADVARGRARLIAHVGALDTGTAQRLAAHAVGLGVDGVAAVPPVYFRVDEGALYEHYRLIADAAGGTTVYVYNIPSATGVEISARVMEKLIAIPAVRGIKYSSYNLFDMRNIVELAPDEINVLSGFDEVCLAGLSMGAHGAIGSTYNIMPATFSALYQAVQAGDLATAQQLQFRANRVIKVLLATPLFAGLKAILTARGYDCGIPRRPQRPLSAEERRRLLAAIDEVELDTLEAEARERLALAG